MIASVEGTVQALGADGVVVLVGGVGLAVQTTAGTRALLQVGESARLFTSLVVREDSLTLYGFAEVDERAVFEQLQTASGVGPRLAQAVLTVHPPDAVRRAVATEDLVALCLVPGIGKKGAQRLVLELKDRLSVAGPALVPSGAAPWRATITAALVGLGYLPGRADEAVVELAARHPDAGEPDVPALLREALARLSRA